MSAIRQKENRLYLFTKRQQLKKDKIDSQTDGKKMRLKAESNLTISDSIDVD